ncbi:CinA family protein [Microlunatus panaciterrae]
MGGSYDVAARVLTLLKERAETLATAESLTGGLIGDLITSVPGASTVYRGGVITYATELKTVLAGVSPQTLTAHGPVAEDTAAELAYGAAQRCRADWGIAATGVAGPDRQDGQPVGTVFVAAAHPAGGDDQVWVERLSLSGSRAEIRRAAAVEALSLLERSVGMCRSIPDVM